MYLYLCILCIAVTVEVLHVYTSQAGVDFVLNTDQMLSSATWEVARHTNLFFTQFYWTGPASIKRAGNMNEWNIFPKNANLFLEDIETIKISFLWFY